ncbi:MAG TPA: hypothetical protein DCO79_06935, partial [Spirochaeta sp.]|nr:hypothetical protein [Spirochaeta sp.]
MLAVLDENYNLVNTTEFSGGVRATGINSRHFIVLCDESLKAFDKQSLELVFTTEIAAARMALTNEKIFLTGDTGTTAINAYTGTTIWNETIPADDLISSGEWIFRLDKNGGLACFNGPYNVETPVTELSIEPTAPEGQNDYYITTPVITLESTDTESYAAETMYSINEAGYVNYTAPFELPEGFISLSWYSTDNHGYQEELQFDSYKIDTAAPVTSLSTEGTEHLTGYFNSDSVVITLDAVDAGSGLDAIYYNLDGSEDEYASPIILSSSGEYTLTYWAEDLAGNKEEINTYNIVIDRKKPKAKLTRDISPGIGIITITGSDKLSGIDKIWYSFNGGSWLEYTGPLALPEGRHQLDYYAVDKAGNQSKLYYRNIRIPPGDDTGLININLNGTEPLNAPDTDLMLNLSCDSTMENIRWYAEIENEDGVEIGTGNDLSWTVPYTEDTMILRITAGADLIDPAMTVYTSEVMLVENQRAVEWNSLERDDYYAGRTLPFDPVIFDARGMEVDAADITWSYTINEDAPQSMSITDGEWSIPNEAGRIAITASYPE